MDGSPKQGQSLRSATKAKYSEYQIAVHPIPDSAYPLLKVLFLGLFCTQVNLERDSTDYEAERKEMVQTQTAARGIKDMRVLATLGGCRFFKLVGEKGWSS
jgi:hypothetical protein